MAEFKIQWIPGFDHAGIATQTVVEKRLLRQTGKIIADLKDEEFLNYCESWKTE